MRGKCFMKLSLPFFVFFSCKMPWNRSTWSSTWSPPAGKSHHNQPLLLASTSGMLPGIKPPTQPTPQTSQVSAHPRAYPASHHRPGDQNVKRSPPGDPLLVAENTKISCVMFFFFFWVERLFSIQVQVINAVTCFLCGKKDNIACKGLRNYGSPIATKSIWSSLMLLVLSRKQWGS